MRRPTKKTHLVKYYEALHDALEREMTSMPDPLTVASLTDACRGLEDHLERCPEGEAKVRDARDAAMNEPDFCFVGVMNLRIKGHTDV